MKNLNVHFKKIYPHSIFFLILGLFFEPQIKALAETKQPTANRIERTFRLHLASEPITLDPTQQRGSGAMYLMNSLQWPLFRSDLKQRFKPGILKECHWLNPLTLSCSLRAQMKWSNGKPLTAHDVQRTFNSFKNPNKKVVRSDLIRNIKTILIKDDQNLQFLLEHEEVRFQERLTSPLLAPIYQENFPLGDKAHELVTSGPYKIVRWEPKKKISLIPNPFFQGALERPNVEFYFIPEDITALTLYEKGQLDFLRRIPTAYLTAYSKKNEFHQSEIVRFDYVGFGPQLESKPELRKILSLSLAFDDWGKILNNPLGRPGCFGIARHLILADPCLTYDPNTLSRSRHWLKIHPPPNLDLHYSALGGEDHKRSMEWLQSEWKKNLGLQISVKGLDNALFQREMIENPAPLFRFGVTLEHLSCFNALTEFLTNPDRPLPFKTEPLKKLWQQLEKLSPIESEEKLCRQALQYLLNENWIIPLGRIQLSYLVKSQWKGWQISALNFLDLSDLHWSE